MADAFKLLINADTATHAARHLKRVWSGFDDTAFLAVALPGLDGLEFKARALRLADALQATLPDDLDRAFGLIESALAAPLPLDDKGEPVGIGASLSPQGLAGWVVWSLGEFVSRRSLEDPARALACLHALTQRFTAEFAIRRLLHERPQACWPTLQRWAQDPSAHVRRLASEGSRPRLPWGLRLQALVQDPSPTEPLLRALQDDSSAYVRRSVANHLNDIAKDHPERVTAWVREHLPSADARRQALLRHASRTLIKQGHVPTLQAWGLSPGLQGLATLALSTDAVRVGESVGLRVNLHSHGPQAQALEVDYAVVPDGGRGGKTFKGWRLSLAPAEVAVREKQHPMREVSTRRLYPGPHRVDLLVNGAVLASATFTLTP